MQDKKEAKRLYDIEYRRNNLELIKDKKRRYNSSPAGRAMQKRNRNKFKSCHNLYCMRDEYRKKKHQYDVLHGAKVRYGEWAECMIIVEQIEREVIRLCPDKYERAKFRGVVDRTQAKLALKRSIEHGWAFNWGHVLCLRAATET